MEAAISVALKAAKVPVRSLEIDSITETSIASRTPSRMLSITRDSIKFVAIGEGKIQKNKGLYKGAKRL